MIKNVLHQQNPDKTKDFTDYVKKMCKKCKKKLILKIFHGMINL